MALTPEQEVQLRGETERGARARAIFESELLQEAFIAIEEDTFTKWSESPLRDTEGQLQLRMRWHVIQQVKRYLLEAMETGKLAAQTIIEEEQRHARANGARPSGRSH